MRSDPSLLETRRPAASAHAPGTGLRTAAIVALLAAVVTAGCGRNDQETAGQKLDGAIATAQQKADEVKDTARRETAEVRASASAAADRMTERVDAAKDVVVNKVDDAAITAAVNAELAKDSQLSAVRINVDTAGGRVLLKGTAPDTASRERASQLAATVKGVTGVDNQLIVRG